MKYIHLLITSLFVLLTGAAPPLAAQNNGMNAIERIAVNRLAGVVNVRIGFRQPPSRAPSSFVISNPARIVLDFPATENGLGFNNKVVREGELQSYNLLQAGSRSRLVLNLDNLTRFVTRTEGNEVVVSLMGEGATGEQAAPYGARQGAMASPALGAGALAVRRLEDLRFRRNKEGSGLVFIDLSNNDIPVDVRQKGSTLLVTLKNADLPQKLRRLLEVVDFGTPIDTVNTKAEDGDVIVEIKPSGLWEHTAYQSDKQFIVEVKPVKEDPSKLFQGNRKGYQGEAISLNFQNIPLRELLHVFADITNFNIVISDTVGGNVSLRLNDVPWDQALEIVLQQKNLSMRKNGSVIWIATQEELAARDVQVVQARKRAVEAEPPRLEAFQLNYIRATDFLQLLTNPTTIATSSTDNDVDRKSGAFLSGQGVVTIDERTNQMFVFDVPAKLDLLAGLVKQIDKPVRQVMIEARIVEANDGFQRSLGSRLGFVDGNHYGILGSGSKRFAVGSKLSTTAYLTGQIEEDSKPTFDETYVSDMPAGSVGTSSFQPGAFSFVLFNRARSRFLNLEISALESDGRGKVISSPRVVTADQEEATIEQGTEVPYLSASSSGATAVSFKKAVLSLKVTPQITPDGRVLMNLSINKDSPNTELSTSYGIAINTNRVETDVLVDNGGTVVIGGIYSQTKSEQVTKIPFLGDLPGLGAFFRNRSTTDRRSELLVFITPRIVADKISIAQ